MAEGSEKPNRGQSPEGGVPSGRSPKELKKLYRQGRISVSQPRQGASEPPSARPSPEAAPEVEQRAVVLEMLASTADFADIRDIMETFIAGFPDEKKLEAVRNVLAGLPGEKQGVILDSLKRVLKKEDRDSLLFYLHDKLSGTFSFAS